MVKTPKQASFSWHVGTMTSALTLRGKVCFMYDPGFCLFFPFVVVVPMNQSY